eukprot:CAMPEP_0206492448 /NCGR_PEP_ID=MMETSP0324_2-20121206/46110_1 /ASSEMBLY_ACC=CAM_ASM_000836 /TAXON_ID=2866 /ORGANISM="Crypthecodinium cohnii, Strain Seligo" /LENGTH=66 /DNA_ID=CAMNT_0053974857 /DNA_START=174 /DNA_END=372 /DNA_ORIENTATION=+
MPTIHRQMSDRQEQGMRAQLTDRQGRQVNSSAACQSLQAAANKCSKESGTNIKKSATGNSNNLANK